MFVNLGGYLDVSKKKKTTYRRRASAPSILKTRILCLTTIHIYQSNNFLLRKKKYMCSTKEQKLTLNPLLKRHFYLLPLNKQQFHLEENESFFGEREERENKIWRVRLQQQRKWWWRIFRLQWWQWDWRVSQNIWWVSVRRNSMFSNVSEEKRLFFLSRRNGTWHIRFLEVWLLVHLHFWVWKEELQMQ